MKINLTLIVAALSLVGCAGVAPDSLKPTDAKPVLLRELKYQEYYSFAGNLMMYTIAAGSYVARGQDSSGVYFEGPPNCFTIQARSDSQGLLPGQSYRCGIHIPHAAAGSPRVWFYRNPAVSAAVFNAPGSQTPGSVGVPSTAPGAFVGAGIGMSIVQAFDAAELKNMHFFQDQPKPEQWRAVMQ